MRERTSDCCLASLTVCLLTIGCGSGLGEPRSESADVQAIGNGIVCTKKTIGAQCDDRNSCTVNDRCTAALTCAGTPYSCDDGDACTADACDGAGGCTHTFIGPDCDDGNPCTADACDGEGGCIHTPLTGTACDDGNACTSNDVCQSGVCVAGTPYRCDTENPCTVSACDGNGACTAPVPVQDGTACDDGRACTFSDVCQAGLCTGTQYKCKTGNQCMISSCDGKGGCATPIPVNGGACDDGNACTSFDSCQEGVCVGGPPPPELCNDGIDNDCNGLIDGDDAACQGACVPTSATEDCNTPEDDDCDGLVNGDDQDDCINCFANPCGSGSICGGVWCVSSCHDGYRDSDESDVDCGGGCPHCANGKSCWGDYDCQSNNCVYSTPRAFQGVCMP